MEKLNEVAAFLDLNPGLADCVVQITYSEMYDIAEAFRALERRAEAAEAKLAELEKQEPVAWRYRTTNIYGEPNQGWTFSDSDSLMGLYQPLFTRPAPTAELMPDDDLLRVLDFAKFVIKCVRKNGEYAPLSSQEPDEIGAILRKIEETK